MKVSVCMPSYNRPEVLRRTLESIYAQTVPFDFETIVVDDGDVDSSLTCAEFPVTWIRSYDSAGRHTPSVCRNLAYRKAQGEIIISQSDDVMHHTPDAIRQLVEALRPGTFVLARVVNVDETGMARGKKRLGRKGVYVDSLEPRPLFFLGAVYRADVYAIGGCDEELGVAFEDKWFSCCLMNGLGLTPIYADHIEGWHQDHLRQIDKAAYQQCRVLYWRKKRKGRWYSAGGSWL